jgi:hypothetical protein
MKHPSARPRAAEENSKWGYATAGAIALAFAAVIQFAFGDLSTDTQARLPAFVRIPYAVAGKLGLTVPMALVGLGLIGRDVLANRRAGLPPVAGGPREVGPRSGASSRVARPPVPAHAAPGAEPLAEELEAGEPLPGEEQPAEQTGSGRRKIPALPGGFDGRVSTTESGTTAGPAPAGSEPRPAKAKGTGTVELSSAKYLNKTKQGGRNSHQGGTGA